MAHLERILRLDVDRRHDGGGVGVGIGAAFLIDAVVLLPS
jgi:hypothetical protein